MKYISISHIDEETKKKTSQGCIYISISQICFTAILTAINIGKVFSRRIEVVDIMTEKCLCETCEHAKGRKGSLWYCEIFRTYECMNKCMCYSTKFEEMANARKT